VDDYKHGRLDKDDFEKPKPPTEDAEKPGEQPKDPKERKAKRREYLRAYFRWLWPHRYAVAVVFVLALMVASLQLVEPLFMRFIIDRSLLRTNLDLATRIRRLNLVARSRFVLSS